jgi:hypothetical protein
MEPGLRPHLSVESKIVPDGLSCVGAPRKQYTQYSALSTAYSVVSHAGAEVVSHAGAEVVSHAGAEVVSHDPEVVSHDPEGRLCHTTRNGGCVTRPGAEVVSHDTVFDLANLARRLGGVVSCAARGDAISRLCQFCQASVEISSAVFQFEICVFQFAICNVLFLQSTPSAYCRKVNASKLV